MVAALHRVAFAAHASALSNVVVMACLLPILVTGAMNLVLHPQVPVWGRAMGAAVILPILVYDFVALRLCLMRGPVLEIDERGVLWRRWSATRIPWSAVERWRVRSTLGHRYVTLWLRDRSAHRATTINGWLAIGNRSLGCGDLTLAAAGTDARFEDLVAAIRAHAPGTPAGTNPARTS